MLETTPPIPVPLDPSAPVAVEFSPRRTSLLIAFGGLGVKALVAFEFTTVTSKFETVNKIFLRDERRQWYHGGIQGLAPNIELVAAFLRRYTQAPATKLSVAFGNSGGGYAALLFGHLLGVDEVHAISPRTRLDPLWRLVHRDSPHMRNPLRLLFNPRAERQYFDLRQVLSARPNGRSRFHIHYASEHTSDARHARRMQDVPQVTLHEYQHSAHNLVRMLRDTGKLEELIAGALRLG